MVVAGSARLEPALAALNSGADGYVMAGPSLDTDLPRTVAAAIARARRRGQAVTDRLTELAAGRERAELELARVDVARREADQRREPSAA